MYVCKYACLYQCIFLRHDIRQNLVVAEQRTEHIYLFGSAMVRLFLKKFGFNPLTGAHITYNHIHPIAQAELNVPCNDPL
jgi:hypothetical protein